MKSSICSLDTIKCDLPYPSAQLTTGRRHNDLCEDKLSITRIDSTNYRPDLGLATFHEGFLNLKCHYLRYSQDRLTSERQKFYCVLRLDNTPCARTTLVKRHADRASSENLNCKQTRKIEFNEQFISDVKDKTFFDIVLCQFIDR